MIPSDEVERKIATFAQALSAGGLRLTHQRLEVAREVAASDTHPGAEEIYHAVRQRVPTISLDTVYRTLSALVDLGLVDRVHVDSGAARYDANTLRHHHFICTRCGAIHDVPGSAFDGIATPETSPWGRVEALEVQLRGICESCERRENQSER